MVNTKLTREQWDQVVQSKHNDWSHEILPDKERLSIIIDHVIILHVDYNTTWGTVSLASFHLSPFSFHELKDMVAKDKEQSYNIIIES